MKGERVLYEPSNPEKEYTDGWRACVIGSDPPRGASKHFAMGWMDRNARESFPQMLKYGSK